MTYVNASGETVASLPATVTTTGTENTITIHRPAAISGADGWNVYVATGTGAYYLQNASPLALGTHQLTITAAPATTGANPPAKNTATTGGAPVETCTQYYSNDNAFEIEYAPFGVESGLCMGLASTAFQGEGVTLQPCGVSARTVWIQDTYPGDFPAAPYYAAINGSDTNFSSPFVLTYPSDGYPTDKPRPQVTVTNLTGFSASVDNDDQLWTGVPGVLP